MSCAGKSLFMVGDHKHCQKSGKRYSEPLAQSVYKKPRKNGTECFLVALIHCPVSAGKNRNVSCLS
jgi:hypothetical protein